MIKKCLEKECSLLVSDISNVSYLIDFGLLSVFTKQNYNVTVSTLTYS